MRLSDRLTEITKTLAHFFGNCTQTLVIPIYIA